MFKTIRKYVVHHDGLFYACCDAGGDKVKLPKDVYLALPDDARHAFNKLKPFSYFDQSGRPAHPAPAVPAAAPPVKKSPRQLKPELPVKSAPVFTASLGLSSPIASSVPEASPSLGAMMTYDPRYMAPYDPRQFVCAPSQYGPQVGPSPYVPQVGPSQFGSQVVHYGTSQAPPVHFMPPDPPRAVAFGAPSDSYASNRASVQFQNSPQVFFCSPCAASIESAICNAQRIL
jgi:hypothetical protein